MNCDFRFENALRRSRKEEQALLRRQQQKQRIDNITNVLYQKPKLISLVERILQCNSTK